MTIGDITTFARDLVDTDSVGLSNANVGIFATAESQRLVGLIQSELAQAKEQFGDFNTTALPTYTITMTNSQKQYDLNDISTRPETIMAVEVLDASENAHRLDRVTLKEIMEAEGSYNDYHDTDGLPLEWEWRDNHIILHPAPDNGVSVTLSNGLIIYYLQAGATFSSSDVSTGTKVPGLPQMGHEALAYGIALRHAIARGLPNVNQLREERDRMVTEMLDFISRRDQSVDYGIKPNMRKHR